MKKAIKIIKKRKDECLKHLRYLESKLGDIKYHRENFIDDTDLERDIEEFNARTLECEVILKKFTEVAKSEPKGCDKELPNNLYCGCGSHNGIILCDECKESTKNEINSQEISSQPSADGLKTVANSEDGGIRELPVPSPDTISAENELNKKGCGNEIKWRYGILICGAGSFLCDKCIQSAESELSVPKQIKEQMKEQIDKGYDAKSKKGERK